MKLKSNNDIEWIGISNTRGHGKGYHWLIAANFGIRISRGLTTSARTVARDYLDIASIRGIVRKVLTQPSWLTLIPWHRYCRYLHITFLITSHRMSSSVLPLLSLTMDASAQAFKVQTSKSGFVRLPLTLPPLQFPFLSSQDR